MTLSPTVIATALPEMLGAENKVVDEVVDETTANGLKSRSIPMILSDAKGTT